MRTVAVVRARTKAHPQQEVLGWCLVKDDGVGFESVRFTGPNGLDNLDGVEADDVAMEAATFWWSHQVQDSKLP